MELQMICPDLQSYFTEIKQGGENVPIATRYDVVYFWKKIISNIFLGGLVDEKYKQMIIDFSCTKNRVPIL